MKFGMTEDERGRFGLKEDVPAKAGDPAYPVPSGKRALLIEESV